MSTLEIVIAALILLGVITWAVLKSPEPGWLIVRWIITILMITAMLKIAVPMLSDNQATVIVGVLMIAACAIIIGITWAKSWTIMGLQPLTSAFDGGDEEIEATALYSAAETKWKKGLYREAIADIHQQLEKFPNDFRGLMMLAQIHGENLNDLVAAQQSIDLIADTHQHIPAQASGALIAMVDMHLKAGNVDAARKNLERILELFPDTPFSQLAAQRLSHLLRTEQTIQERGRTIAMQGNYAKHVGLQKGLTPIRDAETNPSVLASEYVNHLQEHPLDVETRQRLAALYAEQFQRIDLARLEFEHLIGIPNQSPKQITQHLNSLADWEIKAGQGDAARATILRIIEMFPKTALADAAETRLARLGSELKGMQKSQASVKLGSYKKDLGLNPE